MQFTKSEKNIANLLDIHQNGMYYTDTHRFGESNHKKSIPTFNPSHQEALLPVFHKKRKGECGEKERLMRYTCFRLTMNGNLIGTVAVMDQAINAAKRYAVKNGSSVSVRGIRDDGKDKEVIYHPDGRIEKIWELAQSSPFCPEEGMTYRNAGGGTYRCTRAYGTKALMVNTKSGWSFCAHGCRIYFDGSIEWDYSTGGAFDPDFILNCSSQ